MNISVAKVMMKNGITIYDNAVQTENVNATSTWHSDTDLETNTTTMRFKEKVRPGWTAFDKHRDMFKSNLAACLERQVR